ncbi:Thiol:disulfide interchange protein DsbD [Methylacidimicrobium cyclopophantes]|uniref:Thiol:disulfide interchange protein DsbD n=1 Tax=Methylacidimicrobium cyclopophantes TaxID=1041766 RepID=A0A5E6M9N6_9BACT|nr:protein-disulfide reductase DsbD domain-containing protein [Methylacidimicrobium cyclopophantes]VVM05937.1 Thiol:disulfide interchange protein DsbD [Methylacidimicrobium cyclopophantes]
MKRGGWFLTSVVAGLFLLGAAVLSPSQAAESLPARSKHVEATLLSETNALSPGVPVWVAVRLRMEKGWHTYWRNPGNAGSPTRIDWELPAGFQAGPIQWPVPEVISVPPLTSYGYEGEAWLLASVTPPASLPVGQTVALSAKVSWVECAQTCIPASENLLLILPVTATPGKIDPALRAGFQQARAALPQPPPKTVQATAWIERDKLHLELKSSEKKAAVLEAPRFLPAQEGLIVDSAPQTFRLRQFGIVLEIPRPPKPKPLPRKLDGVLLAQSTEWKGTRKIAWALEAEQVPVPITLRSLPASKELWLVLGFAFLGGLILNLMPCVFPVLSLKVLHLVERGQEEGGSSFQHGLAFLLGVVSSFLALAALLLALRARGAELGWGFQLQSAPFVGSLVVLFFLVALSLFGVFEFGASFGSMGEVADRARGLWGSFGSGVLATVVASPCTAPFMGMALGFALTQPMWISLLVFASLGLGVAAPVFLLCTFPALLRLLPRPGRWMEDFKQLLGFPMMGAVVWLLWVYGKLRGIDGVGSLLLVLVAVGFGAWLFGRYANPTRILPVRLVAGLLSVLTVAVAVGYLVRDAAGQRREVPWIPYSAERLNELRAKGVPVFLDFTAAWCLTCKVNERVALDNPEVRKRFADRGVVWMVADWTNRDPAITQALTALGRSGVPAYVLYGPDPQAQPKLLPELLTPSLLLDELDRLPSPAAREPALSASPRAAP